MVHRGRAYGSSACTRARKGESRLVAIFISCVTLSSEFWSGLWSFNRYGGINNMNNTINCYNTTCHTTQNQ